MTRYNIDISPDRLRQTKPTASLSPDQVPPSDYLRRLAQYIYPFRETIREGRPLRFNSTWVSDRDGVLRLHGPRDHRSRIWRQKEGEKALLAEWTKDREGPFERISLSLLSEYPSTYLITDYSGIDFNSSFRKPTGGGWVPLSDGLIEEMVAWESFDEVMAEGRPADFLSLSPLDHLSVTSPPNVYFQHGFVFVEDEDETVLVRDRPWGDIRSKYTLDGSWLSWRDWKGDRYVRFAPSGERTRIHFTEQMTPSKFIGNIEDESLRQDLIVELL